VMILGMGASFTTERAGCSGKEECTA